MYRLIVSCYYWPSRDGGLKLRNLTFKQQVADTEDRPKASPISRLTVDKLASSIERRSMRRLRVKCEVELAANLSLLDSDAYDAESNLIFFGQINDLSAIGLAMVLPATIIDERFCTGSNRLKLSLHLPHDIIRLEVAPVRCERLTDAYSINGYLLGTKITNVEQRESFERYLDSVSGSSLSRHPTSDV
jgi:hypothetical protein